MNDILLEKGWAKHLKGEFEKPYMVELNAFLEKEYKLGKTIYPEKENIFSAFNQTPFSKVKVVIIGQDPYHGKDQAHGLCFSVRPKVRVPPSLQNIYKELNRDLGIEIAKHGYLVDWAQQGVLLLNATLTVESSKDASHQKKGWETFTDKVVDVLNTEKENLIFVLWGRYAQKKGENIKGNHVVLKSTHPSPLSAYRGFLGCGHFSKINQILGDQEINWQLS